MEKEELRLKCLEMANQHWSEGLEYSYESRQEAADAWFEWIWGDKTRVPPDRDAPLVELELRVQRLEDRWQKMDAADSGSQLHDAVEKVINQVPDGDVGELPVSPYKFWAHFDNNAGTIPPGIIQGVNIHLSEWSAVEKREILGQNFLRPGILQIRVNKPISQDFFTHAQIGGKQYEIERINKQYKVRIKVPTDFFLPDRKISLYRK